MPKFVDIAKAKGFKVGDTLFTMNKSGKYGTAKLVKREETAEGWKMQFEEPQYFNPESPAIAPVYVDDIAQVALMRDRKIKDPNVTPVAKVKKEKPAAKA